MDNKVKKILFEGNYKRFISENGWEYTERIRGRGVVAIIAINDDGKVIFVEQHRVPVGRAVIELPAGISNDLEHMSDESLEEAAHRELLEETGYQAENMVLIAEGPSSAASLSDVITLFRAYGLKKVGEGGGDPMEQITVHEVHYEKIDPWLAEMRSRGFYVDPKVYAALYLVKKENGPMNTKNSSKKK